METFDGLRRVLVGCWGRTSGYWDEVTVGDGCRFDIFEGKDWEDFSRRAAGSPCDAVVLDFTESPGESLDRSAAFFDEMTERGVPIIVAVGKGRGGGEERFLALGAADVVDLPVPLPLLSRRLRNALAATEHGRMNVVSDRCRQLQQGWQVVSELFSYSLRNRMGMQEQLEMVFDFLDRLPWCRVARRGSLMLLNSSHQLVRVAQCGFADGRSALCERVDLDRCGCGMVAQLGEVLFRECEGDQEYHGVELANDWSHFILPLADGRNVIGVASLFVETGHEPSETEKEFMASLALALSGIVSRRVMDEAIEVREMELEEKQADAIRRLGAASEYRDSETGMHVVRMSHYAGAIAKSAGMSDLERERLVMAAPMHDVGKIGIPDSILLKPGRLDAGEFETMKAHTEIGGTLLKGEDSLLVTAQKIAETHHEKWDGSGYPAGLKGDEIPLAGRICAIADVFDALTSRRPYKEPWPVKDAAAFIRGNAGKAFDPVLVEAFDEALPEILRIRELYRDDIIDPRRKLNLPAIEVSGAPVIAWDQSIRVGIDVIDEHHRYLFDLTNELYVAIKDQKGVRRIGQVLRALESYTHVHFGEEERMMRHYGYSDLERHLRLHAAFCLRLRQFWGEFKRSPLTMGFEMVFFLRDWLINHIQKEDTKMEELLVGSD